MGNTRFVGELYMIQLLSANIMSGCIGQLVHSNSETELESLCKLIEAIGEKYSTEDKGKEVILYSLKSSFQKCLPLFLAVRYYILAPPNDVSND